MAELDRAALEAAREWAAECEAAAPLARARAAARDRVRGVPAATLESSTATDTESAEAAADSKPLEVISETRAVESSSVVETPLRSSRDAVSVKDTDHV